MLATVLVSVLFFGLLVGMMAIGVIFQGKRLSGSCGGDPDSAHCGCSPEKKAVCRDKRDLSGDDQEEPSYYVEQLRPLGRSSDSPHRL